jgi:CelD/BcsL family acetyltransferase involved in cellulose biosynthesis
MKVFAVSVGVIAYNEEGNIGRLLHALLGQRLHHFTIDEILVVASGCTDRTTAIVNAFCTQSPRVKLLVERQRRGKAAAINLFLRHARHDYLVVTSADVLPRPDTLEYLLRPLLTPAVGMTGARPVPVNTVHTLLGRVLHLMWHLHHLIALEHPKLGEMVALRRVFDAIPHHTAVDEVAMEALVSRLGYRLVYVPEAVVYNKGPETVREFLGQRRRIFAGHLLARRAQGYTAATLSIRRIFRHLGRECIQKPSTVFVAGVAAALEALGRLLGLHDVLRGRAHTVWQRIDSTKTLHDSAPVPLLPPTEPGLEVTCVESFEDFLKLEECWNRLLESSATNSIYMTFEWMTAWWRHFHKGRDLFVLLVKEAGQVIAIAPLMITTQSFCGIRLRMVKFLGTGRVFGIGLGLAARVDFILAEDRYDALWAIMSYIHRHEHRWDLLDFRYVPAASPTVQLLGEIAGQHRLHLRRQVCTVTLYLPLRHDWQTFLRGKSKNFRKKLRQAEKRSRALGAVEIVRYTGDDAASDLMPMISEIDRESWQARRGVPVYATNRQQLFFQTFVTTARQRSWPEIWVLKIAGDPVAYEFGFLYNGRFSSEVSAYKQSYASCSPGHLLTAAIIKDLFDRKAHTYDFGMEVFRYKERWTTLFDEELQIVIYKNTVMSKASFLIKVKAKWVLKKSAFVMSVHRKMLRMLSRVGAAGAATGWLRVPTPVAVSRRLPAAAVTVAEQTEKTRAEKEEGSGLGGDEDVVDQKSGREFGIPHVHDADSQGVGSGNRDQIGKGHKPGLGVERCGGATER